MSAKQLVRSFEIVIAVLFVMILLRCDAKAKSWRGIVPLKSTRVDVESQFGKANEYGSYQIKNERATVFYSDEPCEISTKCECLVPKGTVLRISVTLDSPVKLSHFNIDKKQYIHRKAPYGQESTYSDFDEGVVYAVDESRQIVTGINYWPSKADCNDILKRAGRDESQNVWRGLRPLRSTRVDVERLVGTQKDSAGKIFIYETPTETIHVTYSEGDCKDGGRSRWNVPTATILEIRVFPRATILLRDLHLNIVNYKRMPDPSIPNWAFYSSDEDGVMIQTKLEGGCEQVVSLTYEPTAKNNTLRCVSRPLAPKQETKARMTGRSEP